MVRPDKARYCYDFLLSFRSSRNGDPMSVAGLSPQRGNTLERPAPRPRAVPAAPATDSADSSAAAAENADCQQADYFLHLLAGRRRLIDHRVDEYQKAVAVAEANGDAEAACSFRRMVRLEIQDRQTVDGMLEKLHRRFLRPPGSDAPAAPPRTRLAVR
jgi:hypothetical protein